MTYLSVMLTLLCPNRLVGNIVMQNYLRPHLTSVEYRFLDLREVEWQAGEWVGED